MLHMNDDSEEIFRRAAENYPLKTDSPDWEPVLKKLKDQKARDRKPRKRRTYILLLLLFLLSLTVIQYKYSISVHKNKIQKFPGYSKTNAPQTALAKSEIKNKPGNFIQNEKLLNPSPRNSAVSTPGTVIIFSKKNITAIKNNEIEDKQYIPHNKSPRSLELETRINIIQPIAEDNASEAAMEKPVQSNNPENSNEPFLRDNGNKIVTKDISLKQPEQEAITISEKKIEKIEDTSKAIKKAKPSKDKIKHIYAGIVAGPDFSSVKLQPIEKAGLNFGVVAGYRINKNFSIETGFLHAKKQYNSKGQYFSTINIHLPEYSYIEHVKGDCNMWELPLNLNYSFSKKGRSAWFISAGVSAYLMYKDSYNFDIEKNGEIYPYSKEYNLHDNKFPAVINIGGGYTYHIGKAAELRIQPYAKIPLNKIGTGELSIQSAGIMAGYIINLF